MAAVTPGLTSVLRAGRRENDMEMKAKGSLLAIICLSEVREWDMLSRDRYIFLIGEKCGVCPPLIVKEAGELNIFSWAHCPPN